MLNDSKLIGFVATTDYTKARAFYEGQLGLRFISQDQFALVLDSNGNMIRIPQTKDFKPQSFTVLGWEVVNIENQVAELQQKGITFEKYGFPGQDERGIWSSPGGAKVAWFKDPDGNLLSISQHT
jgi:catechol 2,3-dioxygenase-like lactoylglutathione lyase family enzyme